MGNRNVSPPTHAAPVLPKKLEPLHLFLTNPKYFRCYEHVLIVRFFSYLAYSEATGYKHDFHSYLKFVLPLIQKTGVGFDCILATIPFMNYPLYLLDAYLSMSGITLLTL